MIRQTIEHYIKSCNGDIPPIAIYPYGKDGLFVKHILNNQFGIREKYLVDNTLCNYNPEIISSKEMLNKEENITVIISTVSRGINKNICEEISKSGSSNFSIINIIDPIIHKADKDDPYYGELKELLRVKAVTGHSFTRIGRLNDGGYACGAVFDGFSVKHIITNDVSGLHRIQGTKYQQSNVSGCYKQILKLLKDGKKVIFGGTSCQVAGLIGVVGNEVTNLITVDLVCYGVPSPLNIWIEERMRRKKLKRIISNRDKKHQGGWLNSYHIICEWEDGSITDSTPEESFIFSAFNI